MASDDWVRFRAKLTARAGAGRVHNIRSAFAPKDIATDGVSYIWTQVVGMAEDHPDGVADAAWTEVAH